MAKDKPSMADNIVSIVIIHFFIPTGNSSFTQWPIYTGVKAHYTMFTIRWRYSPANNCNIPCNLALGAGMVADSTVRLGGAARTQRQQQIILIGGLWMDTRYNIVFALLLTNKKTMAKLRNCLPVECGK